ncbi:MAG: hypothetical protein QOH12_3715 [Solirubrobacteraceae bacterium]|nr:hypothetical protein [Solirubrobacteraceae bacterium]
MSGCPHDIDSHEYEPERGQGIDARRATQPSVFRPVLTRGRAAQPTQRGRRLGEERRPSDPKVGDD